MAERAGGEASAPRSFRFTVRTRLALTYAVLLTIAGAVLLAIIAFFIGLVPSYDFAEVALPAATLGESVEAVPAEAQSGVAMPLETVQTDPGLLATTTAALTVSSRSDILQLLLWVSAGVLMLLAVGGAWAGWFVAGRMLRPLQDVNRAASRAARGHLDHRIALVGPRDEITELADTFDGMLESLERSVAADRRFAANASHELRTPLATSRAMLDVALGSGAPVDPALLVRLREMNERSIATVEALLDLAEIESAEPGDPRPVRLDEVVGGVLADAAEEAARAGVELRSELARATVDGDETLLRQLAANLVQNAIRHNERGGRVAVDVAAGEGGSVVLEVENDGAALDPETVDSLVAPFARGGGRTRDAADRGRGLGLSIVAAVAERHGAELELAARDGGGLRATVRFGG